MFDDIKPKQENKNEQANSKPSPVSSLTQPTDKLEKTATKPTPGPDMSKRIASLREKGKRRGKRNLIIGIIILLLFIGGAGYASYYYWDEIAGYLNSGENNEEENIVCAQDAKECPDGTFVSRIPPDCEFAQCPEITCVEEGGYVDHPDKDSFECCKDLIKVDANPVDENCEPIIPENSTGIEPGWACINCGDGICAGGYENKCNCPEDCKDGNDIIFYQEESSWGPCANPEGGCFLNTYIYDSGKVILESKTTEEKQLTENEVNSIKKKIQELDILNKECDYEPIVDLSKYYIINIDGETKEIIFPGCEGELDEVENLIDSFLESCCELNCGDYHYSNCPEGCTKKCIGSCPMCSDCDGDGSCYCEEECNKNCAKEGEEISTMPLPDPDLEREQCCEGLVPAPIASPNREDSEICDYVLDVSICLKCGDGICDAIYENKCNCTKDCSGNNCAKEGEMITTATEMDTCCQGLTQIGAKAPDGAGNCDPYILIEGSICTYCGNGECGLGENKCNCPEDCGETTSDVASWQIYRNEELGYKFKYPNNWFIENDILYSPEMYNAREGGSYSLNININSPYNTIQEYLDDNEDCMDNINWFTIDETEAVNYIDSCVNYANPKITILKIDDQLVELFSYSFSDESNIVNSIISTFKFIQDTDNDGLYDDEEALYGTDINNPDTDGDGYLDGDEVEAGYNPNGEGKL